MFFFYSQCEDWISESSTFLLQIGRKATECKSSTDAMSLISDIEKHRAEGAPKQDQMLEDMEKITVDLYGWYFGGIEPICLIHFNVCLFHVSHIYPVVTVTICEDGKDHYAYSTMRHFFQNF